MAFVGVTWVLLNMLVTFLEKSQGPDWQFLPGNIQGSRITADHAWETKWGGQVTWRAEYKLAYVVSGHEYVVWADSGIRGESEDEVRLWLTQSSRS